MQDDEQEVRDLAYRLWEEAGKPEGRHDEFWHKARERLAEQSTADSFPASDPPSHSGITGLRTEKTPDRG
ncbi:MAG: DUF2934 domain-containing protein [Acidiphilium sp.]